MPVFVRVKAHIAGADGITGVHAAADPVSQTMLTSSPPPCTPLIPSVYQERPFKGEVALLLDILAQVLREVTPMALAQVRF
jgi:hypothetical protein